MPVPKPADTDNPVKCAFYSNKITIITKYKHDKNYTTSRRYNQKHNLYYYDNDHHYLHHML